MGLTSRGFRRNLVAVVVAALSLPLGSASAHTDPLAFDRKTSQRGGPYARPYAAMTESRPELRVQWKRFNQSGKLPTIGFKRNVAILVSFRGSGSCGVGLHDLRLNRERKVVIARLYHDDPGPGNACTDDLVPYTFVVAVSRADLEPFSPGELSVRRREIPDPNPG